MLIIDAAIGRANIGPRVRGPPVLAHDRVVAREDVEADRSGHVPREGATNRLGLVLGDHDRGVRRVRWDDKQPAFRPIQHG